MKRGFKALAVLAAVVAISAGPEVFAFCDTSRETYAIFHCANRAYFAAPPAGSGAVSAVFWDVGFGNKNLNTGVGLDGTGFAAKAFNGNDNGLFTVNVLDAASSFPGQGFPPGSLCLGNNNWGNADVDGCNDNPRDTNLAFNDDDLLNPLFDVEANNNGYPGVPDSRWIQDGPLGVLLTESTGHHFALAAVANTPRQGAFDVTPGQYDLSFVSNGLPNAITAANNVVPWQRIPGDRDPGDPSTNFVRMTTKVLNGNSIVDLGWRGVVVYSDQSSVPSTNAVVNAIGLSGMGTNDHALVRYVIEENHFVDTNTRCDGVDPNGWTAHTPSSGPTPDGSGGFTAQTEVPPATCLRLHTYFGVAPQTSTHSGTTCRQGTCGDLGYEVISPAATIAESLAADGVPRNATAIRGKGGVDVSFETSTELSVTEFKIYALTPSAGRQEVATLSCKACTTGDGAEYTARIPMGQLKGARDLEIEASTGASARVTIK